MECIKELHHHRDFLNSTIQHAAFVGRTARVVGGSEHNGESWRRDGVLRVLYDNALCRKHIEEAE